MISIRAHLLWSLLPAFAAISIVAGFGVYVSTKAELEARLDAELAGLAIELQFAQPGPERDAARNRFSGGGRERTKPTRVPGGAMRLQSTLFTNLPSTVYGEVRLGDREVRLRTQNLQGGNLPTPAQFGEDPVFYDATFSDGVPLRAWAAKLNVTRGAKKMSVILAVERASTNETLTRLARDLVSGGVAFCLVLSLLLVLTLRVSLKPLRNLGDQAALMDAGTLHERFSERSVPSDIRPIVARLNDLMAKLEESFARERRFSGDLAHELRTPLAAIRTTSEVALKWPEQASAEDYEEIHALSSGLQQTLDSLLTLARMESAAASTTRETIHPAQLAEECAALHTDRAQARGLDLDLAMNQDFAVETDPRILRIIMSNLIGNAVDYAPEGSRILVTAGAGGTLFSCENVAPNLTAEDVDHLFERMWRKDAARTESGHAGLGLSIAKACADALGLYLTAELNAQDRLRVSLPTYVE